MESEIKKMEAMGIEVTVVDSDGKQRYVTPSATSCYSCNGCEHLRLIEHPDPDDWFADDEVDAVCILAETVLDVSMRPYEVSKLEKPAYCPLCSNVLTLKQKENFEWAKKLYKENT